MKYSVIWADSALSEVAAEFVATDNKVAIIDSSRAINLALESDPYANGTHLTAYLKRNPAGLPCGSLGFWL